MGDEWKKMVKDIEDLSKNITNVREHSVWLLWGDEGLKFCGGGGVCSCNHRSIG